MIPWQKYDYGCIWMATLYLPGSERDTPGVSVHGCSSRCVCIHMQIVPGTSKKKPYRGEDL